MKLSYRLKCKKQRKDKSKSLKTNGKTVLLSKCAVCGSKTYIKKQEASQILSSLDLKTPLSKIPLFGDVLF